MSTVTMPCIGHASILGYYDTYYPSIPQYDYMDVNFTGDTNAVFNRIVAEDFTIDVSDSTYTRHLVPTYPFSVLEFNVNVNFKYKRIKKATLSFYVKNTYSVYPYEGVYIRGMGGSRHYYEYNGQNYYSYYQNKGIYKDTIGRSSNLYNSVDITSIFNSAKSISGSSTSLLLTVASTRVYTFGGTKPQPVGGEFDNNNLNSSVDVYLEGYGSAHPPYITIEYEDVTQPAPTPVFPKDVYSREGDAVTFQWQFSSSTGAIQKNVTIAYKLESAGSFTEVTINSSSARSYTINGLAQGSYIWKVKCTNDADEQSSYSSTASFTVIGKPSLPIFNDVDNKTLTTITWNAIDQNAYELKLSDASGHVIDRVSEGTDQSTYKPNMFLKDGNYLLELRYKNSAGYWSDWGSTGFTINPTKPDQPDAIVVSGEDHVTISTTTESSFAIVRKHGDIEEVLAMNENDFVDKTMIPGISYGYCVRAYDDGYTDSEVTYVTTSFYGAIIHGRSGEVHLRLSVDKYAKYNEGYERASSVVNYIGREYPMTEKGTYSSKSISREYVVSAEDKAILEELANENSVYYRDTHGNSFHVTIIRTSYANYLDMGYQVSIEMVRTHGDEVKVNV